MKIQQIIGRVRINDSREMVLYERDGVYSIRVNGLELMSSRTHGSEDFLARTALASASRSRPVVLIGGLGMGFTLRAVLDSVPAQARVVVAEIFSAVVAWNRQELAKLAGSPLLDSRVKVAEADVADIIHEKTSFFDVVLMDVDNGPEAFTISRNRRLYGAEGIAEIRRCLRPQGVLGVWSAEPDQKFERRLTEAGFHVRVESVRARPGTKGPMHTIFVAVLQ